MKPDKEGIWEWFEEDGTRRLMSVFDVSKNIQAINGIEPVYLRVYWWGGYYDVNSNDNDAMWPDRWGKWIGENGTLPEEQLYNMPTPKQMKKIQTRYQKPN